MDSAKALAREIDAKIRGIPRAVHPITVIDLLNAPNGLAAIPHLTEESREYLRRLLAGDTKHRNIVDILQ